MKKWAAEFSVTRFKTHQYAWYVPTTVHVEDQIRALTRCRTPSTFPWAINQGKAGRRSCSLTVIDKLPNLSNEWINQSTAPSTGRHWFTVSSHYSLLKHVTNLTAEICLKTLKWIIHIEWTWNNPQCLSSNSALHCTLQSTLWPTGGDSRAFCEVSLCAAKNRPLEYLNM